MNRTRVLALAMLMVMFVTNAGQQSEWSNAGISGGTPVAMAEEGSAWPSTSPTIDVSPSDLPTATPEATVDLTASADPAPTPTLSDAQATDATATDTPAPTPEAPLLFAEGAACDVTLSGDVAASGMQLRLTLEVLEGTGAWSPVPDPVAPEEVYTLDLTLDANGDAHGIFSLAGLAATTAYRARVSDWQASSGNDATAASFAYADGQIDDATFETQVSVSISVPEPATPTPEPTATPEPSPTAEVAPVFMDGEAFTISIAFSAEPEGGYGSLSLALFADEGGGAIVVASQDIAIGADGTAQASFSLAGLSSTAVYSVTALAYQNEPLSFVWDEALGASCAEAGGCAFTLSQDGSSATLLADPLAQPSPDAGSLMTLLGDISLFASGAGDPYSTALTFTLNLALNGAASAPIALPFTLVENADTGAYTCELGGYDTGLFTASASVSGTTATLNILPTVPGGDPTLRYTLAVDAVTLDYTLTDSATGYQSAISGSAGVFADGTASADASAMALTSVATHITWNDGKSTTRPTPVLTISAGGVPLSPQPAPTKATANYSLDIYTYAALPKYDGGTVITYTVAQESPAGYLTVQDGLNFMNTLQTALHVGVQWYDGSTAAATRPAIADVQNLFTLKRQARRAGSSATAVEGVSLAFAESGNLWNLTADGLPAYDADGYPYDYMVVQGAMPSRDETLGTYVNTVKNVGIYNGQTAAGTAYEGGTLVNTMTDFVGFAFTKVWKDGGATTHPTVRFYLYRYPENTGLGFATLSPVTGHDNMTLPASDQPTQAVTYAEPGELPRYDTKGNAYVYYLREVMDNQGDYQIRITNVDSAEQDFILPGATVVNIREANTAAPYTVFWRAKAVQSMNGGAAVALYRKLATEDDTAYTYMATQTLTGFRAETMTLTSQFGGLPKYDAEGALYQYRVREVGATIDAVDGAVPTDNIVADSFTDGGFTFTVTQPAPSGSLIENTLVGTTSLRVVKRWSPALAEGTASGIHIRILQNSATGWDASGVTVPAGASSLGGTDYSLTGTGDLDRLFTGLPQYDSEGREYVYTVQELLIVEPTDYAFSDVIYSIGGDGIRTATLYNTKGGEGGLTFRINKVWLDDGDLLRRVPVTFALYYTGGGSPEPVAYRTLTAAESWTGLLGYTPAEGQSSQYADYMIREVTGGSLTVGMDAGYLASGSGEARTAQQKYSVSTAASGNTYTVTNLRVGKLQLTASKTWHIQDIATPEMYATFTLFQNGTDALESKTIALNGPPVTFGGETGLQKYDSQGVIIPYSVRETSLTDAGGTLTFSGGRITINTDEAILSSVQPGAYQYGATLDDPDTMSYAFANSLAGSDAININLIWRDAATGDPRRPDVRLTLYRHLTDAAGAAELVATVRLWNTNLASNPWYWTCGFGAYAKFDAEGNRYHYFVKETFLQESSYVASYFSDIGGVAAQPDQSGQSTEATFPVQAGETRAVDYAYASFDPSSTGTIINTLEDTLDVQRKKIWSNLPGWFQQAYLPTVQFRLHRSLSEATTGDVVLKDGNPWVETLANGTPVATFAGAPVYNVYGLRYHYYVEELDQGGGVFDVDWYSTENDRVEGTVTNVYAMNGPSVSIEIQKQWDYPEGTLTGGQSAYPAVAFELRRYWQSADASATDDVLLDTVTMPSGTIASLTSGQAPPLTVTEDANGDPLLRYAPDGYAYRYYVLEKPVTGYTSVQTAGTATEVSWNVEGTVGTAAFTNTYVPQFKPQPLTATKHWDDGSDQYGTRPSFSTGDMPLAFALWRKTSTGVDELAPGATFAWREGSGANADDWYCDFEGDFPTYSTLGQTYTYYVKETLAAVCADSYALSAGAGTLRLVNSLNRTNVLVAKNWESETGTTLTRDELTNLKALGALPDAITFTVHQSADGGTTWDTDLPAFPFTAEWADLLETATGGRTITVGTALPRIVPGTSTPYVYRAEETALLYRHGTPDTGDDESFTPGAGTVTVTQTANHLTTIANEIGVRKLYFVKNWMDDNDRDGARPTSLVLTVTPVAGEGSTTVTLSAASQSTDPSTDGARTAAANRWRAELTVPAGGDFTVTESLPGGYTQAAGSPATQADGGVLTNWWGFANERTVKQIAIKATKTWAGDSLWYAATRPASVSFQLRYRKETDTTWINLYALSASPDPLCPMPFGSAAQVTLTPSSITDWSAVFAQWDALPAYAYKAVDTDVTIGLQYSVVEVAANGYNTAYSPSTITAKTASSAAPVAVTVTNTLRTISLQGAKHWVDESNRYSRRPSGVTLTLLAGGVAASPQPTINWVKTGNDWTYSITGLPRYQKGTLTPVVYTVTETVPPDYRPDAATVSGTVNGSTGNITAADFTNRLITVDISGQKTWADDTNRYGMRPDTITLTVLDGAAPVSPQPDIAWVKGASTWAYTMTGLPRYAAGTTDPITYSVCETAVGGYLPMTETTVTGTRDTGTGYVTGADFTNTLATVSLGGSKTWADFSDWYGLRPSAVTLTVRMSGTALSPQPALTWQKTGDLWTYACEGLPKYLKGTYTQAAYTVVETAPGGYAVSPVGRTTSGTVDGAGNVTAADFLNTLETITLSGSKTWADTDDLFGRRPADITLTILADGIAITPNSGILWDKGTNPWTYTVADLPRYRKGTTTAINYSVREAAVPAYAAASATVSGTVDGGSGNIIGAAFTNTLDVVSIGGQKTWVDENDRYGTRPDALTLTLLADGEPLAPQPSPVWDKTDPAVWTYIYSGVPHYQSDNMTAIVYTVKETPATGYVAVGGTTAGGTADAGGDVTGADLTNELITVSITGRKTWADDSDRYGMRPDGLTLTVLVDGTPMAPQPSVSWIKAGSVWTYTIDGLPRYQAGTLDQVRYTVQEAPAAGYELADETAVTGLIDADTGNVTEADFANTLTTVSIRGTKTWVDGGDRYAKRPDTLTLTVLADGAAMPVQPEIMWTQSGNSWTYAIEGLPRYRKGSDTPAVYTVRETSVSGYAAASLTATGTVDAGGRLTGADFTNTLHTITLSGSKTWADDGDRYGTRPDALTLTVLGDGTALDPQPDIDWTTSGDTWTYTVTGLPRYQADGTTPVAYTVQEADVAGYAPVGETLAGAAPDANGDIAGIDFENRLLTVTLSGTKTWDDLSDRHGIRPANIALIVLADGVALDPQPTATWDMPASGDSWTYAFAGLPRYRPGTATPVVYSVHEATVAGYLPADDSAGTVDTATGDVTSANLANTLEQALEIDNRTLNSADGYTDAGGFVSVGDTLGSVRDIDPYHQREASVCWQAETGWLASEPFTVSYLPHGADEATGWRSVTASYSDLSALTAVPAFANATLREAGGVYTLQLADSFEVLPRRVRVLVTFTPTLAIQNLTRNYAGGTVSIQTPNNVEDGRYVALVAYAQAESGYQIEMHDLRLIVPELTATAASAEGAGLRAIEFNFPLIAEAKASGTGDTASNVRIVANAQGSFTAQVGATLAGALRTLTVTGNIRVLALDANGNPSRISITVDALPVSLNIGVAFGTSVAIPVTDDPVLWVAAVFAASGVLLLLLRRKRAKGHRPGPLDGRKPEV